MALLYCHMLVLPASERLSVQMSEHFLFYVGQDMFLRYTGHNSYGKLEDVGIRVLLPLAGFWLFFRIFADSVSFLSFTSW